MEAVFWYLIGFLIFLFCMLLTVGVPIIFYKLSMKRYDRMVIYFIISLIFSPMGAFIALILLQVKLGKTKDNIYNNVINNCSDESIDALINFINSYGCANTPNAWHQLRGVWFAVNECPDISTDKKKELKIFFMAKGLYLHKDEGQIIDNYSK